LSWGTGEESSETRDWREGGDNRKGINSPLFLATNDA